MHPFILASSLQLSPHATPQYTPSTQMTARRAANGSRLSAVYLRELATLWTLLLAVTPCCRRHRRIT
jgi:hypothetical protein